MSNNFNKEKFEEVVGKTASSWGVNHQKRRAEQSWKQKSAIIALNVLTLLEEKNWSQARLATELKVSAQHISNIVKGRVNFTLESIAKLEAALGNKLFEINLIDRDREARTFEFVKQWIDKELKHKAVKTKTPVTSISLNSLQQVYSTDKRQVPLKQFNSSEVADYNLRPTG
ncbi:XRE family transcriptional regulator [Aequorivita sp. H23M31]|uniref:XRE family transcriptional regulator n=1 Tax=Aequorivita ciconiae TaxID=2494375 RepID=A0A410G0M6_9FLAO|nr:helix-turn-helix transcriptional regulator [Aequorivita sp. H23M31]QAA80824.1 XRE family transcriptional regulator [Aequorivita sp. H23M31]